MHDYDMRHFRFERSQEWTPAIEGYAPPRFRWGIVAAIVVLAMITVAVGCV